MEYRVTDHGLNPDGVTCNADAMSALLAELPANSTLIFPRGRYYFAKRVEVGGKAGLTMRGEEGATLLSHFGPCGDPKENNNIFWFHDCADLSVRDFTVTTDNPIGWAGVVTEVNLAERYYIARIYDEFEITGFEHPVALNSCDAEGTPDYQFNGGLWSEPKTVTVNAVTGTRLGCYDYEVIGDHLLRFNVHPCHDRDLARLQVGEQLCYRFIVYGNTHFSFDDCDRVEMKNIEIERASSMGAVIGPRCSDFTFDNFNIRLRRDTQALYAANADGIHILGLTGYLHMYNCHFNGLGDDTLNIHGTAGEIREIRPDGSMLLEHRHRSGFSKLQKNWAREGDVIEVYDSQTFLRKGTFTIGTFSPEGDATITASTGTYAVGDALANTAYFAATHLRGCDARNTRARGFLLQTRNVIVEDCHVYGMSLPSIIVSPDIKVWFEVGPSENVVIRNNVFEKCAFIKSAANLGAIVVKGSHDVGSEDYPAGVHRNMTIENNVFRGMGNSGVYVSATDGVTVRGNTFDHCSIDRFDRRKKSPRYDIVTRNCDHVTIAENKTTKDKRYLFYPKGCHDVSEND